MENTVMNQEIKERSIELLRDAKDNNVQKFNKAQISVDGGVLKSQSTSGFFRKMTKQIEIPIEKIQFIDVFHHGLFRYGVDVTYDNSNSWIWVGCNETKANEFVSRLTTAGAKIDDAGSFKLKQGWRKTRTLRMENGRFVYRVYKNRGKMKDSSNPKNVIYFDKNSNIFGQVSIDFGSLAGGGEDNSISVNKLTPNQAKEINQFLLDHGAQLANTENAQHYKSVLPVFKPIRWFSSREQLAFTDKGILHMQHTFGKSRSSFLPYETIKVVRSEGFILKKVFLQGATTVATIERFWPTTWNTIKSKLKEHNIEQETLQSFRPNFFSKERWNTKKILMVTKEGVIFREKKETSYLKFENIHTLRRQKLHFYNWFGTVLIYGSRRDARQGEGGEVHIELPKIGPFRWGSIKSAIRPNLRENLR